MTQLYCVFDITLSNYAYTKLGLAVGCSSFKHKLWNPNHSKYAQHVTLTSHDLFALHFQVKTLIKRFKAWRNRIWDTQTNGCPKSHLLSMLVLISYERAPVEVVNSVSIDGLAHWWVFYCDGRIHWTSTCVHCTACLGWLKISRNWLHILLKTRA